MQNGIEKIKYLLQYLLRKWMILIASGIIGGLVGIGYATLQKAKYEARLTFSLEENGNSLTGALSLAAEFGFNLGGGGSDIFSGDNILTVLNSRRIIESVLLSTDTVDGKAETLANQYMDIYKLDFKKTKPIFKDIRYQPNKNRENFTYHEDSILYSLYDNIVKHHLRIKRPDKRLNFYEITFVSRNERYSKVFIEKLIDKSTEFYIELKSRRSRETLEILQARAASMRGGVQRSIENQATIRDENLNPAFAAPNASLQKQQIDATAYARAYEEIFKTLEIARYQYLKNIPLLQIIDQPNYPMKKIKTGRMAAGLVSGFIFGIITLILLVLIAIIKQELSYSKPIKS